MRERRRQVVATLGAVLFGGAGVCRAGDDADESWPERVVKFEDLRPLTPFQLQVRGIVAKGRVTGPTVLKVHVRADGTIARAVSLQTCGNPDLDEAALHAMRVMKFDPYQSGAGAEAVTLVVPVHIPVRLGRS